MIKCSKCKKEITTLFWECCCGLNLFYLTDDEPDYGRLNLQNNRHTDHYKCSKCLEVIATTEEGAIKILKGKPVPITEKKDFEEFHEDAWEIKHKLSTFLTKWHTEAKAYDMDPDIYKLLEKAHTDLNDLL